MPVFLESQSTGFGERFQTLLRTRRGLTARVDEQVAAIIEDVRTRGDAALIELTARLDRFEVTPQNLCLDEDDIARAAVTVPQDQRDALSMAAERIHAYHSKQFPEDRFWEDECGARLGWRWSAIAAAGLYVPGGLASYPSSVLMNAIPATIAGVGDLSIAAPTPDGQANPLMLLAAELAGIRRIYRIGGAQAIAALALGTETVMPVDKIAGPGNAYVSAAKRQLFGTVGIEMIAGPSEIVIIADATGNPSWIAADLLAQAEHDRDAQSILITDCRETARQARHEVERQLELLPLNSVAGDSWRRHGAVIVTRDAAEAVELANRIAPEHLQLCVREPGKLAEGVRHAGAVFLGGWSPEVIGDYVAGPSHVLPTHGAVRFSSGLSVPDFMKRTSIVELGEPAFSAIGPAAEILARAEGLAAHAASIRCRLDWKPGTGR